jgi:hypothetical protein
MPLALGSKANPRHAGPLTPPGNHIPTQFRQPSCAAIPGTVRELCGKAGVNSMALCRPLLYGLHIEPLERGWRNPRKRHERQPCTRAGRRRDVAPVERVSSITFGPVRPSPPLCHHLGHCCTILGAVGARDDETLPRSLLCIYGIPSAEPSSQRMNDDRTGSPHATTLEAAPRQVQDSPRRRSGARFARTTVNSVTLYAMPPYVALRTVRHDCKPPPLGL